MVAALRTLCHRCICTRLARCMCRNRHRAAVTNATALF